MKNIELYFGSTENLHTSEQSALRRILRWLSDHQQPAVVICDVWLQSRQIDILVGTSTITLQIEIKGYRAPVTGQQNGEWTLTYADGSISQVKNGYQQALRNNQTLRNEMSKHVTDEEPVSYPQGAVMFEPSIPSGSALTIPSDPRVAICGADELDRLLSAPGRSPWPLTWLRDFARTRNLIARPISAAMTPQIFNRTEAVAKRVTHVSTADTTLPPEKPIVRLLPKSVAGPEPAPRLVVNRMHVANDAVPRKPVTIEQSRSGIPFVSGNATEGRPKRHSRILRYASVILTVAGIAYAGSHWYRAIVSAPARAHASQPGKQESRSPSHFSHTGRHIPGKPMARQARISTLAAPPVNTKASAQTRPEGVPAPSTIVSRTDTSAITCPAGVDRLGCNGKTGVLATPECPLTFHVFGNTCVRDQGD
ncbi:nuclease-related domain-containing protein [Burkholderia seminalis]|uniref:nuclease-related domain-containing protein n=1 Tax=Burkholderia seminalis TaxID=488731 RepID=UPI002654AD68|nr:NERD domain-containing protein [Burkholderia seminalis]MDN7847857.1 NERD domain-containing protein [Burkholderia seminalis]